MIELNLDGLVGPTHGYAGLSPGNLASLAHRGQVSSPRGAALEGLRKMRFLRSLGIPQAVLPPHERPDLGLLRRLGFSGSDAAVLARAHREAPHLLAAACSASAMWAANAATVAASADTEDGRVHFTVANLVQNLHRSIEPATTARSLRRIFPDESRFAHHAPLPATPSLGDEGAANHTRFWRGAGAGAHLFVYGREGLGSAGPRRFSARQARAASEAIARLHGLDPARTVFARQSPEAIDRGVFHNDVIAVGHRDVLFHHERAFVDRDLVARLDAALGGALRVIEVPEARISLDDAVSTYLFNAQLVTDREGRIRLIAPTDVRDRTNVAQYVDELVADKDVPIDAVDYLDVRQSMQNGGGPACLRLRVWLTAEELARVHPPCVLDDATEATLTAWVERHYRDTLAPADLADPALVDESRTALDELTRTLGLGDDFYDFQRAGSPRLGSGRPAGPA